MGLLQLPYRLKPFQVDAAAKLTTTTAQILGLPTGSGKSLVSLVAACLLLEDNKVDHVIIECEVSKLDEWESDILEMTTLKPMIYAGTPKQREKLRNSLPEVAVGVFETIRGDLVAKVPREGKKPQIAPGPLLQSLLGKRVLFIQDEGPAKMGADRGSLMYKAHELARRELLKHSPSYYNWVLSATPMDRDPIGYFNVCRLLSPSIAGTVADFERNHVDSFDFYGNPVKFKDLDMLQAKMAPLLTHRSKSEPEIVQYFPKLEDDGGVPYTFVDLTDTEQDLCTAIYRQYGLSDSNESLFMLMRQVVGHPMALTVSEGSVAQDVLRIVGAEGLSRLPTSKLDRFVEKLKGYGSSQVVAFTYFGQSVLPFVLRRLLHEGFTVVTNHGQMSYKDRKRSKDIFNHGDAQIYLSSDAGARGINLPVGQYAIHYDLSAKASIHTQRIDRISRIDSVHPVIYTTAMVVRKSVEVGLADLHAKRQGWAAEVVGDDGVGLSSAQRKAMLDVHRLN